MADCRHLVDSDQEMKLAPDIHLFLLSNSREHRACSSTEVGEAGSWDTMRRTCLLWSVCSTLPPHHQKVLEENLSGLSFQGDFWSSCLVVHNGPMGVKTFTNSPDKFEGWGLSNMNQMQQLSGPGDCRREGAVTRYLKQGKYWLKAAALRHLSSARTRHVIRKLYLFLSSSSVT